jgi:MFS family permease
MTSKRQADLIAVNAYWFGINLSNGIITPLLLPYLVTLLVPSNSKNTALATLRVVGLSVAMLVQPIAGLLSDRSPSRFGRRRPFILVSALLSIGFVSVIGLTPSFFPSPLDPYFLKHFEVPTAFAILLMGLVFLQFASNIGQGALQGLIPDLVPETLRGRASGIKSVLELLPSVLIVLIGPWIDQGKVGQVVGVIIIGFLVTMAITLFRVPETPLQSPPKESLREPVLRLVGLTIIFVFTTRLMIFLIQFFGQWIASVNTSLIIRIVGLGFAALVAMAGTVLIGVYYGARIGIGPEARFHQSFIWWVINRLLFLAAIGSIQGFALYYLRDALNLPNAATVTTQLLAVVAVFLIASALASGALADRVGYRKLIFIAGVTASAGTVLLLFATQVALALVSGCIIGAAVGTFMATNWALGTQLAPAEDAGRYLGISNLAGAGAGIVGAGIGGPLADYFNQSQPGLGYLVLFSIYAGLFLLSAITLFKTHSPLPK